MPAATVTVCSSRLCLLPQSRGRHRRVPCRLRFQSIRRRRSTGLSSLSAWHAWRTGTGIFRVHPLSAALLPFLPWTLVCSPLFQVGFLILPCLPGHPLLAALLRVRLRGFKRSPFLPGHPHLAALPRVWRWVLRCCLLLGHPLLGGSVPRLSDPRSTRSHSSAVRASA